MTFSFSSKPIDANNPQKAVKALENQLFQLREELEFILPSFVTEEMLEQNSLNPQKLKIDGGNF